jgi:hypothetical protein
MRDALAKIDPLDHPLEEYRSIPHHVDHLPTYPPSHTTTPLLLALLHSTHRLPEANTFRR